MCERCSEMSIDPASYEIGNFQRRAPSPIGSMRRLRIFPLAIQSEWRGEEKDLGKEEPKKMRRRGERHTGTGPVDELGMSVFC